MLAPQRAMLQCGAQPDRARFVAECGGLVQSAG
jgi:hypothetical protein